MLCFPVAPCPLPPNSGQSCPGYGRRVVTSESRRARDERLFQSLPELGSADYLNLLKPAVRKTMPAGVLVRAYRLLTPTEAAKATITRLVDRNNPPGYIAGLYAAARRRRHRLGAYTVEDLEANAVGEIFDTIDEPPGRMAEGAWALYLQQCVSKRRIESWSDAAARGSDRTPRRLRKTTMVITMPSTSRTPRRACGAREWSRAVSSGSNRSSNGP
jgi:hypothetical protein